MALFRNSTEYCRELLSTFLNEWNEDRLQKMTLSEYVDLRNKNTFVQWLDTRTDDLGSIKGVPSTKFGIYKRGREFEPKYFLSDKIYSWNRKYGASSEVAFKNIKGIILEIINFAKLGQYEEIDALEFHQFTKWKIAFLFSNEHLIPIYKKEILIQIAEHFQYKADLETNISVFQRLMILNKPVGESIFDYGYNLIEEFSLKKKKGVSVGTQNKKSVEEQNREFSKGSYIAKQIHNKLQNALMDKLVKKYGAENVKLELNYIDITVKLPSTIHIYEIKSHAYASECVREALGQVLHYTFRNEENLPKQVIIIGPNPPNIQEKNYIEYIQNNLSIPFRYEFIKLNE